MNGKISVLIISYNRPQDLLELLQSMLPLDKTGLREVLILNNASTLPYDNVESFIENFPELKAQLIHSTENLGVSRGRNKLMQCAQGEFMLVVDDDILFTQPDSLTALQSIFERPLFKLNNTAVITFRILYADNNEPQVTAFPHKEYDRYKDFEEFLTSYFVGCAHLMKQEVVGTAGLYPDDFFYGMEEYDLSYRIINSGYTLGYNNQVTFLHKEARGGRQKNHQKLSSQWVNKAKVAWRYLPLMYFFSTAIAWNFQYLRNACGHWRTYFRSWGKVLRICFSEKRTPVDQRSLKYLKGVRARLWY